MMIMKNETKKMLRLSSDVSSSKIFLGKKGLGKYTVAKTMAAEKLSVSIDKLEYEPSFREINGELSIDELRKVLQNALYKSSKDNIILVDMAEKLSIDEQNVLLKTIEEGKAIVYFITTDTLLDTIHSRCHTIEFFPYEETLLEAELTKNNVSVNHTALQLCGGCPGIYFNLTQDTSFLNEMEEMLSEFQKMQKKEDVVIIMKRLGLLNDKSKSSFFEKYADWQVAAVLEGILNIYVTAFTKAILSENHCLSFYSIVELEDCIRRLKKLIANTKKTRLDCLETIMLLKGGKAYVV